MFHVEHFVNLPVRHGQPAFLYTEWVPASAAKWTATLTLLAALASAQPTRRGLSFEQLSARADAARDREQLTEAKSLYHQALAIKPSWAEGWWSLGTILYDQNSYAPAARAFRKVLAYDPNNGTARLMLALCEYQLNLDSSAMKNIQAAKKLGIRKDEALRRVLLYHEAMLLLRRGRYEDGIEALKPLAQEGVDSEELDAALGLGVLMILPKDAPSEGSADRRVLVRAGQAERHRLLNNFDEAGRRYAELAQQFPNFPNIHYAYGRFLLAAKGPAEAIVEFQQEIKNNPAHIRARMQIATAYYRDDSAAGIPYAQEVVKLQPSYPFGHFLLGVLYFDSGDARSAIPELETAARMVPHEAQFQFVLSNAYTKVGRKQDAARARAAFLRLDKNKEPSGDRTTYGDRPVKLDPTR
jgi:tetratricopeptide (TPR) repeat protein